MDEHIQNVHNGSRFKCDLCDFTPSPKSGIACLVDHRLKKHQVGTEGYPYYKCLEKSEDCTYYASSVRDLVDHMLSSVHASDAARYKVQEEGNFYWAAGKEPFGEAEASADKADVYVVPRSSVVFVNSKKYRKCLICDELCTAKQGRFNQDADGLCLKEHAAEKHDVKLYKCDICNKLFGDRLNVALHVKRQHGLEPLGFNLLECHYPGCKAVFKTKSDFGHHIVSHKVKNETNDMTELEHVAFEKPLMPAEEPAEMTKIDDIGKLGKLQCDICGMTCTNKDPALELELHMEMEHSDKILFCEHCGEDFKDPHSLSYHLRNKHMQQVTGNTRKFDKKKRKEYHDEWVKNAPKKYVTTPEGKTMLAASWKKKNRPQVQCPLCKLVGDQDTLVYHFRMIHLQYKRWGCTICQKRFPSSSNTKYHILRVHEGKGNMDGKLKSVVGVDYFEGKNLLEDFKETEPSNWPNKKCVLEAIAKAREDALTSQLVIVPVTQTITQITVAEEPDGERLIE